MLQVILKWKYVSSVEIKVKYSTHNKRIKSILNYYMIRHVFNNSEVDNLLHRSHSLIGSKTDEEK